MSPRQRCPDARRVRPTVGQTSEQHPGRSETEEWRPGGAHLLALFVLILGGAFVGDVLLGDPRRDATSENAALLLAYLVLAAAWLVALPLSQWLLLRRVGASSRLGSSNFPAPFGLLRAPGQRLPRWAFSLACALPAPFAFVVLPALAVLLPGGVGAGVLVGIAGGLSVYQLRYALLALSMPQGTLVEELEGEEGAVRFHRASKSPGDQNRCSSVS